MWPKRPIQDVRAFECYLRAKREILQFTQEGVDRAIELLRRGLEIVGENALLYATLGMAYWQHVNAGLAPDERYLHQAEECAEKAFQLDPETVSGRYVRALVLLHRGQAQRAVLELGQALRIEPDNPDALLWRAVLLGFSGKDSTREAARLAEVDPLTPFGQMAIAWCAIMRGQFVAAAEKCRGAYEQDPDNPITAFVLAEALARSDRRDEATTIYKRVTSQQPETMFGRLAKFLGHALSGEKAEALRAVTPALTNTVRWDLQYSWQMATAYALIGERVQGFEWLERAIRLGFVNYPFLSQYDPLIADIRQDARFSALMQKVRLLWEQFEV